MGSDADLGRVNRNLDQLLQELRVALPGVQVLFAFLLTAPFNARFERVAGSGRVCYLVALLAAAGATAFLMAPSVHHRLLFHRGHKRSLVRVGNAFALVGMALLAVALASSVALVTSFIFATDAAVICTALVTTAVAGAWLVTPLLELRRPADPTYDRPVGDAAGERAPARTAPARGRR